MSGLSFNQQQLASSAALLSLLLTCYWVLRPFVFDLLWAGILGHVTWPLYQHLRHWGLKRLAAAACMVLPMAILVLLPLATVALTMSEDVNHLKQWLDDGAHRWPAAPAWLLDIPVFGQQWANAWLELGQGSAQLIDQIKPYALTASAWLLHQGLNLMNQLLHLGLSLLVLLFVYRDGEQLAEHAGKLLHGLAGTNAPRILGIVRSSLRAVVYGIVGTALAQALASMLGLMIAGVPYAFELSLVAFFLMMIPAAGTVVWLPISAWLLMTGEPGWAVFIALWFVLFVGTIDNWLRPLLISREVELPFVLIVFGILGGLLAFGFIGAFLGPTLLSTAYALLMDWLQDHQAVDPA